MCPITWVPVWICASAFKAVNPLLQAQACFSPAQELEVRTDCAATNALY